MEIPYGAPTSCIAPSLITQQPIPSFVLQEGSATLNSEASTQLRGQKVALEVAGHRSSQSEAAPPADMCRVVIGLA
jgi:hypothetical protein